MIIFFISIGVLLLGYKFYSPFVEKQATQFFQKTRCHYPAGASA